MRDRSNGRENSRTETSVPVVREQLRVGSRQVVTGRVILNKKVQEREELVDIPLVSENYRVERIRINVPVDSAPTIRHTDNTTIIPIVEEVAVIKKQLMLREELRITRVRTEVHRPQRVKLKRERIDVSSAPPHKNEN